MEDNNNLDQNQSSLTNADSQPSDQAFQNQPVQQPVVDQAATQSSSQMPPNIANDSSATQQNTGYQQVSQTTNSMQAVPAKKKTLLIAVIAAAVLVVVVTGIVAITFINSNANKPSSVNDKPVDNTVYTKVAVGDVTYSIPDSYQYQTESDMLVVTDDIDTWQGAITTGKAVYTSLSESKLKTFLISNGITSSIQTNKTTYLDREYYVMEFAVNGSDTIFAVTKADGSNIFQVELHTEDGKADPTLLNKITKVLDKSTISVVASQMKTDSLNIIDKINLN